LHASHDHEASQLSVGDAKAPMHTPDVKYESAAAASSSSDWHMSALLEDGSGLNEFAVMSE
jgi:hypothetical protein